MPHTIKGFVLSKDSDAVGPSPRLAPLTQRLYGGAS